MVTSTSVPASSPVASSGMMTYPSAAVSTDSSADSPNRGVATPPVTWTWTTSRRPAADGRSRASRARTAGSGGGIVQPPTRRTSGTPSSRKTTSADRGLPGSPITGTPSHSASSVGLPGRIAMPWHQIPGGPTRRTTPAVSSLVPTDEPAEITIRSLAGSAPRSTASRAYGSSGTMPPGTGSPPASATIAASATADASLTCPGRSVTASGGTTSSPVENTVTRGRACTGTVVTPAAASMARSWARSARRGVLVGADDALAGGHGPDHLDGAGHDLLRVLDHDHGVRAGWQHAAGGHAHRRAGTDSDRGLCAYNHGSHQHGPGQLEVAGQAVGDAVGVGRPHRVAVDGGPGEAGQRVRGGDRRRRHPVQRAGQRHRLGGRAAGRAEASQRLRHRPGGEELPPCLSLRGDSPPAAGRSPPGRAPPAQ